jgi:hypothetical protein
MATDKRKTVSIAEVLRNPEIFELDTSFNKRFQLLPRQAHGPSVTPLSDSGNGMRPSAPAIIASSDGGPDGGIRRWASRRLTGLDQPAISEIAAYRSSPRLS